MNNAGLYKSSLQPKATTFTPQILKKEVGQEILDMIIIKNLKKAVMVQNLY